MSETPVPENTPVLRTPAAGCATVAIQILLSFITASLAWAIVGRLGSLLSHEAGKGLGMLAGIAGFVLAFRYLGQNLFTGRLPPNVHISHWYTMIEDLGEVPTAFYDAVVKALDLREVPDVRSGYVYAHEAGPLSAQRLYLEITRQNLVFYVCGAPFGNGFFVSWWLGERRGMMALVLSMMPFAEFVFPWLFRPRTYYELDTALMFQSLTHSAVLEVVDGLTKAKGVRGPTELERKPILRGFLTR